MSENKLTDREIVGALENLLLNHKCNIAKSNEQFITLGEIINLANRQQAEIDRLQSILVRFLDEISEWGNKNNIDTTNFSIIPIAESEKESIIKQLRFEVLKEYIEKLKGHWRFRGGVIPCIEIHEIIDETYKEIVK